MADVEKTSGKFIPTKNGYCIAPVAKINNPSGDIHETFHVDSQGNISDAHTTVRVEGGKSVRIDWSD